MKWLFLLLLAANLAYYLLQPDPSPDATQVATDVAAGTPTILLLSEAKQQERYPLPPRAPARPPATAPASPPDTDGRIPSPASPPTAEDLHRAVYPEGIEADTAGQASLSRDTRMEAGDDDPIIDASVPPPPSSYKDQALQAGVGGGPGARQTSTETDTPKPEASTPQTRQHVATTTTDRETCFRVGPFDRVATAKAAGRKMMKLGFRGRLLQTTAKQGSAYLVYLGPYSDPDERQFALDELAENGMNDITLGRGKQGDTLVIASYPSKEQAKPMLATLQTLGYNPHIAKRNKPIRRFYLDLEASDGSGSPSPRDRLTTAFPNIGLKSSACRR
jgi:cell division septation protein DedD